MQRWVAVLEKKPRHGDLSGVLADRVAAAIGSWRFIIAQAAVMALWFLWNLLGPLFLRFDGMPFILLNLAMSAEAAFTGPALLISANRQEKRAQKQIDRMEARQREELAALSTLVADLHALHIGAGVVSRRGPDGRFIAAGGRRNARAGRGDRKAGEAA